MEQKQVEARIYAAGVDESGRSVVWVLVDGAKFAIPTNVVTMTKLLEKGLPIINAVPRRP